MIQCNDVMLTLLIVYVQLGYLGVYEYMYTLVYAECICVQYFHL